MQRVSSSKSPRSLRQWGTPFRGYPDVIWGLSGSLYTGYLRYWALFDARYLRLLMVVLNIGGGSLTETANFALVEEDKRLDVFRVRWAVKLRGYSICAGSCDGTIFLRS